MKKHTSSLHKNVSLFIVFILIKPAFSSYNVVPQNHNYETTYRYKQIFGNKRGAFLAINSNNGQQIAAYDPEDLLKQPFPIGSLIKLFTAVAGLESKTLDREKQVLCPKTSPTASPLKSCWYHLGHGNIDIIRAIAYSCNRYFIESAGYVDYSLFLKYLERFHLIKNIKPAINSHERTKEMVGLSTRLQASPKNTLAALNALFNGGTIYKITDENVQQKNSPAKRGSIKVSSSTIDVLKEGMHDGIIYGTSKEAGKIFGITNVLGKTGTGKYFFNGRQNFRKTHGWWIGFYPDDIPQIAVIVFLLEGTGASDASVIGGKLLKYFGTADYLGD